MPTYIYICQGEGAGGRKAGEEREACEGWVEKVLPMDERDNKPPCPICEGPTYRSMEAPRVLRASFLDGQRSKTDQSFDRMKKASKLNIEAAGLPFMSEEREEIEAERDYLKVGAPSNRRQGTGKRGAKAAPSKGDKSK